MVYKLPRKRSYWFLGVLAILLGVFNLLAITFMIIQFQTKLKEYKVTLPPQNVRVRIPPQTIPLNISGEEIATTIKTAFGEISLPLKIPSLQLNYSFPGLTTNITTPELTFKVDLTKYTGYMVFALLPLVLMSVAIILLGLLCIKQIK